MELFGPGFTWQHAAHPGESFFSTDGQWQDPEKQRECSFLADAANAELVCRRFLSVRMSAYTIGFTGLDVCPLHN